MKNYLFVFVMLSFVGAQAQTNLGSQLTGAWKANSGQLSTSFGPRLACTNIEVDLSQTDTSITFERFKAACGFYNSSWGQNQMMLEGEKVFGMTGVEIGTFKNNVLLTKERLATVDHALNLKLERDSSGFETLKIYYGVRNAAGVTAIEGELHRVGGF